MQNYCITKNFFSPIFKVGVRFESAISGSFNRLRSGAIIPKFESFCLRL